MSKPVPPIDEARRKAKRAERDEKRSKIEADLENFYNRFKKETERGTALAIVALLDIKMKNCLKHGMVHEKPSVFELMFKPDGPLGSFGNRSKLCFLLGYIKERTYEDLKIIGEIRNKFAHDSETDSFENAWVKDKCRTLQIFENRNAFFSAFDPESDPKHSLESYAWSGYNLDEPRWQFVAACSVLSQAFQTNQHHLRNIQMNIIKPLF